MRGKGRIEKGRKGRKGSEDGFFVSLRCCRSADLIRKARLLTRSPNGCATLRFAPLEAQNDKVRRGQARPVRVHDMSGGRCKTSSGMTRTRNGLACI